MKPSGIGGQAVLEGIMMRNRDRYAVAVRKPDGTIAVDFHMDQIPQWRKTVNKIPIVRGVVSFVTSLVVGMQTLTYSASFFEDEEEAAEQAKKEKKAAEKAAGKAAKAAPAADASNAASDASEAAADVSNAVSDASNAAADASNAASDASEAAADVPNAVSDASNAAADASNAAADMSDAAAAAKAATEAAGQPPEEKAAVSEGEKGEAFTPLEMGLTVALAIVMAIGIFMLLPYGISLLFRRFIENVVLLSLVEGVIRMVIFLAYVWAITFMDDIKRTYMYHGSEHKCINCIENGLPLTVENVRNSSRFHKRCGTSFLLVVMVISIVIFSFIRAKSPILRLVYRLLLIPVVAGVSYEFLQWTGRSESRVVDILAKPGLCLQRLTTKEPTDDMIEVAIVAVERVFDWEAFLKGKAAEDCFPKKKRKVKKAAAVAEEPAVAAEESAAEEKPVSAEMSEPEEEAAAEKEPAHAAPAEEKAAGEAAPAAVPADKQATEDAAATPEKETAPEEEPANAAEAEEAEKAFAAVPDDGDVS